MPSQAIDFTPQSNLIAVVSLSAVAVISFSPASSLSGSLEMIVAKAVAVGAGPTSSLQGSLAMIVAKKATVSAGPTSSLRGSLTMIMPKTVSVGARPGSALRGSVAMILPKTAAVAAGPASSLRVAFGLILAKTIPIAASPASSLKGRLELSGVASITFCAVMDEILNLWGIEGICNSPDFAIARATNDVNSAMQTIWNQADDRNYWTSETLTLTFADGEDSQDLPNNIQNVIGPCRRSDNKRPLAIVGTLGELDTFTDLYMDGETAEEPLAYHIDRMAQSGDDPAKTTLRITPAVTGASVNLLLDVVTEAPRFYASDLDECPIMPIPHRYVESLLLPIARYKASSFWLFNNTEGKATIDRDYQMAMEALGMADPLPGKSGDNKEDAS